jgi:hypothetical protein
MPRARAPSRKLLLAALAALAALVALFAGERAARADAVLYTIGAGDYLYSRYGHSLLCVDGRCVDYGVPDREDALHMAWASVRGEPIFVPVAVDEQVALGVFRGQGRSIDAQRLPLSEAELGKLRARLDADLRERRAYAYHPYRSNCTTQVRDRLDEAMNGRLQAARSRRVTATYRDLSEEGLSGRLGELTLLAFLLGDPAEQKPTGWDVMFLPEGLRDGLTEQLHVVPERLEERKAMILPTSRAVGRAALVILALAVAGLVRWGARDARAGGAPSRRARIALGVAASVLGGMALIADLVALVVVWPEFRHNWALLALLPTDLAMPWLSPRRLRLYALGRVGIAALLAALEVAGVIAQPMLHLSIVVAVPMLSIAALARAYARAPDARAVPATQP